MSSRPYFAILLASLQSSASLLLKELGFLIQWSLVFWETLLEYLKEEGFYFLLFLTKNQHNKGYTNPEKLATNYTSLKL